MEMNVLTPSWRDEACAVTRAVKRNGVRDHEKRKKRKRKTKKRRKGDEKGQEQRGDVNSEGPNGATIPVWETGMSLFGDETKKFDGESEKKYKRNQRRKRTGELESGHNGIRRMLFGERKTTPNGEKTLHS